MNLERNEIWDEFQWEEYMRREERMLDRYLELYYRYSGDPEHGKKIAEALGWSEFLDFGRTNEEGVEPYSSEADEELEGESWKRVTGYEGFDDQGAALQRLGAFVLAQEFALSAGGFVDSLPGEMKEHSSVVEFLSQALIVPSTVAKGFEMGTEMDAVGGNIALCKRALAVSNQVFESLRQLRRSGILQLHHYRAFVREAAEVRNAIALHVVDLRDHSRSGLR